MKALAKAGRESVQPGLPTPLEPNASSQQRLYDRVFLLREREPWTFDAIAKLLTKPDTPSAIVRLRVDFHILS